MHEHEPDFVYLLLLYVLKTHTSQHNIISITQNDHSLSNRLPRYYTNAASMTPYCCLCLPGLMRKLAVKERGNQAKLSVSSIKLIPFLNDDTKYDVDLVNWVYQIVYTRSFETEDGDVKIVPMGDVSYILIVLHIIVYIVYLYC